MGFASSWLDERALFPRLINDPADPRTGIIVVIPAFDEPDIVILLESLIECDKPGCESEVIIVVNAPEDAGSEALMNNAKCIRDIEAWRIAHPGCFFRIHLIDITPRVKGEWSVGMARKTGMDEALRRFDQINNPEGIILCLDADCKVERNYFTSVYLEMHGWRERTACSIYFEHPIQGNEFPELIYYSIILYELHLRFYFQALRYTGFPYVHHTVGSAMAVKALPYMKAGGMNRRKAGEDFYFIQKLVPAGGFFNLCSTTVYPSPRYSARVPFGTGVTVSRLAKSETLMFYTFNMQAFRELKVLFSLVENLHSSDLAEPDLIYQMLPDGLRQFVSSQEWIVKIIEIKNNTSGLNSFKKRFFVWFNMFRVVKYLNTVHESFFRKKPVMESVADLLSETGQFPFHEDPLLMLEMFRKTEKNC